MRPNFVLNCGSVLDLNIKDKMEEPDERQSEELEVLRAIFDEDFSGKFPGVWTL